jgi:pSer/pThr/pTyr-binding forkhead associated (FHA) protein
MLFCPPLPPQRVDSDSPVAIGRHPSCEFSIRKGDVSRRHAEVRYEDGRHWLRDLGSTNGTFVNGELVDGEQPLSPGDRIEIGSSTITFCQIDAMQGEALGSPGEDRTIVSERVETRDAFQGELAEIPPFAVLQVLEMAANTGLLEVRGISGTGRVWFVAGQPVHAETEKLAGFDAAVTVVNTTRGEFHFDPQPHDADVTIRANVTELLLEASRRLDEGEATGL